MLRKEPEVIPRRQTGDRKWRGGFVLLSFVLLLLTVSLPPAPVQAQRQSILWQADHEDGTLDAWSDAGFRYPGGGILNTGGNQVSAVASREQARSGTWSAKVTITGAERAKNGNRAVRLMRWTNRAWDDGGEFLPARAYYSAWYYFPRMYDPRKFAPWDPGDGGWWNIFQFKGNDEHGVSQPLWTLNVNLDTQHKFMYLYFYSKRNAPHSFQQANPLPIPVGKWVHFEAYYEMAPEKRGKLAFWQDGQQLFDLQNVVTSLGGESGNDHHPIWGVGSYTDHIAGDPEGEGAATIYIDDAVIRTQRSGPTRE